MIDVILEMCEMIALSVPNIGVIWGGLMVILGLIWGAVFVVVGAVSGKFKLKK